MVLVSGWWKSLHTIAPAHRQWQTSYFAQGMRICNIQDIATVTGLHKSDVHRRDLETAELRAGVQRELWRTIPWCARNGHNGRHDVLEFLGWRLKSDLHTIRYSWLHNEQAPNNASTHYEGGHGRSVGKYSWRYGSGWPRPLRFSEEDTLFMM